MFQVKNYKKPSGYKQPIEHFGLLNKTNLNYACFHNCRETFHKALLEENTYYHPSKYLYTFKEDNTWQNYRDMIFNVENHLQIGQRSKIEETDQKGIIYIELSPWWLLPMRHDFFTICLRAVPKEGRNFIEKIKNTNYAMCSTLAIDMFLNGKTYFVRNKAHCDIRPGRGWVWYFGGEISESTLKTMLRLTPFDKMFPEEIQEKASKLSYKLWEEAGHPEERNQEFWFKAIEILKGNK